MNLKHKKIIGLLVCTISFTSVACSNSSTVNVKSTKKNIVFKEVSRNPRVISNKYGTYYEIFVRSFADSNKDGIGDINGITKKLDYLSKLGVNGIWLTPINSSPSYHKYDVTDYYNIDKEYGTIKDFERLLTEAHKRKIKVLMDLVINHTSSENPWFKSASKSEKSPFRDYYTWANPNDKIYDIAGKFEKWGTPTWHRISTGYFYGLFGANMPDLNYDNPKVRKEVKNVAKFWLKKGVDGFRLDAALHIYWNYEVPKSQTKSIAKKTQQWWKEFGKACEDVNPNVYLIGEVWDKPSVIAPFFKGLDSNFDFQIGENGILDIVNDGEDLDGKNNEFAKKLEKIYATYRKVEPNFLDAPFLTNHDQNRSMSQLGNDVTKAKLAANIYLTLPGNPFIYYGEELGMLGINPDNNIREPFIWSRKKTIYNTSWEALSASSKVSAVDVQENNPNSLLNHYKKLIHLRQSSKALKMGDFKALQIVNNKIIAYERTYKENKKIQDDVVVIHNVNDTQQTVSIKNFNLKNFKIIYDSSKNTDGIIKNNKIKISPRSTLIFKRIM